MRHRVYGKKLGRDKNQRTALFKSLVYSLLTHGTIETTESKAKAVKGLVDRVVNLAKAKNTGLLQGIVIDRPIRERLVSEIAPKLQGRNSGYTSTVRLGTREGDRATLVRMSLIGHEKMEPIKKEVKIKKAVTKAPVKKTVKKGASK